MWILSFFSIIFITQHFFRIAAFEDVPKYETVKFINLFNSRDEDSDGDSDEDDGDTDKCRFSDAFVPNRSNCNQFYICGSDKMGPMLGLCPPGMWFDPEHTENDDIVCIYPEVACTNSQIEMFKYCRCRELFPSGVQASNAKNNDVFIESSPLCIVDNEFHVYASAVDCERYFVCYNGNVKRMQCKAGLHFNAAESYCDDPTRANCNIIDRQCPPTGITFVSHPSRCDAFYYCRNGKKRIQHCGFNEMWDEKTMKCVQRNRLLTPHC